MGIQSINRTCIAYTGVEITEVTQRGVFCVYTIGMYVHTYIDTYTFEWSDNYRDSIRL